MNRIALAGLAAAVALLPGCRGGGQRSAPDPDPLPVIRQVADAVLRSDPAKVEFNWGEGVLMAGMMRAAEKTGDKRYSDFVRKWADRWEPSLMQILESTGSQAHENRYCGRWGPGFPVVMLYEATGEKKYRDMAMRLSEFVREKATRTDDRGFGHWRDNKQLWVDTLYMSCPVMARLGKVSGRREFLMEAITQMRVSTRHLQDDATGLFYHMYDEVKKKHSDEFWGRGNGWVIMSFVETLANLEKTSPMFRELAEAYRKQAGGLVKAFDREAGMWHTVVDKHDSYVETSATAMILYGLVRGEQLGVFDGLDEDLYTRAWKALSRQVNSVGDVVNVSAGTGPTSYEGYQAVPRGTETWGTGAWLLAACALLD